MNLRVMCVFLLNKKVYTYVKVCCVVNGCLISSVQCAKVKMTIYPCKKT